MSLSSVYASICATAAETAANNFAASVPSGNFAWCVLPEMRTRPSISY